MVIFNGYNFYAPKVYTFIFISVIKHYLINFIVQIFKTHGSLNHWHLFLSKHKAEIMCTTHCKSLESLIGLFRCLSLGYVSRKCSVQHCLAFLSPLNNISSAS